jgi:hypothetical protein
VFILHTPIESQTIDIYSSATQLMLLNRFSIQCGRSHLISRQRPASSLVLSSIHPSWISRNAKDEDQQRRQYHATPRNEMFVYASILLTATLGYVSYKKYHGEPLKPKSATDAQKMYETLEFQRKERNKKYDQSSDK